MYSNILVPLDGSELAEVVLPHVEEIARGCHPSTVTFVRVSEKFSPVLTGESSLSMDQIRSIENEYQMAAEKYLQQLVKRTKYNGVTIKWEILSGTPAEAIVDYAKKVGVDLIVIATHGRSGVRRWVLGSTADRIMHSSCAAVLMVRVPGCINIH